MLPDEIERLMNRVVHDIRILKDNIDEEELVGFLLELVKE